ncbi:MAG: YqeG family HAD IIIA-type phosphatase [Coriobacteriales bacterium]|jgi:HAD superfamily phosphatase (TIGR01668 family)
MALFKPDEYLSSIDKIDLDELASSGIRCLFVDIDNTLRPRDTRVVPKPALEWLDAAGEAGIGVMLVSNNWHASALSFAESLGLPVIHKAMKPLPFAYMIAMRRMGVGRRESAAVGDQLLTDILGAHLCGMKAIMVEPQTSVDLKHTAVMRKIERALLGGDMKPSR